MQIWIEYNDRYKQARTYHQLGMVARKQENQQNAQELFIQSLSIFLEYDDTHAGSIALYNLARLWQASHDASIVERIVSLLKVSQERVEKLLQGFISGT